MSNPWEELRDTADGPYRDIVLTDIFRRFLPTMDLEARVQVRVHDPEGVLNGPVTHAEGDAVRALADIIEARGGTLQQWAQNLVSYGPDESGTLVPWTPFQRQILVRCIRDHAEEYEPAAEDELIAMSNAIEENS